MKSACKHFAKVRGFSLVELMVAMTIGLIILSAVSMLFVNSKKTYTTQDSLARLQENGRFAMQFIIKDLRLAGYYGCIDEINADSIGNTLNNSTAFVYNAQIPIEGVNNATGTWYPSGETALPSGIKSGTDAIAIRKADTSSLTYLNQEMPNTSAVLKVNTIKDPVTNDYLFKDGEIIMISDCASADIMQITSLNDTDPHIGHNTGDSDPPPGNAKKELSKAYSPSGNGTRVMKFVTVQYYIANGASGNPALFRKELDGTPVELVDGIENIQVLYGKDTDSDRVPNVYLKAGATGLQSTTEWGSVVSARIGILARTLSDRDTGKTKETDADTGSYDVDGDGTNELSNPGDRYKRRIFQAVVHLRNL